MKSRMRQSSVHDNSSTYVPGHIERSAQAIAIVMSDVKRSLLDMSPGGKTEEEEEPSEDELIESDETFAEFCSRKC
ncbi:hypothetical protein ANCDUO_22371 [Ancylostoma duodenale]|uniref:Uncharacterized protein n=1 Tax=Ancylostoma duodenale TaxID=51022 RepID=A0A0C2FRL1_9BILA|nr:hypothetical protein ANCDUO_22371 [Ancylostoma duodenale]